MARSGFRVVWVIATASIAFLFLQQSRVAKSSVDAILKGEALLTSSSLLPSAPVSTTTPATSSTTTTTTSASSTTSSNSRTRRATALPALLPKSTEKADLARNRQGIDGQFGDPIHLGGPLDLVDDGPRKVISPRVFELLRREWGIRSMIDIGCGRGWSTLWFHLQGVSTRCVEASPAALKQSLLPTSTIVNHDFTRGPWWPEKENKEKETQEEKTIDLVWSTSFVQQVSLPFMPNYFATMSKAAILLVSFPRAAGWHHVEVHDLDWWILQFQIRGFYVQQRLTEQVKQAASMDMETETLGPDGRPLSPTELLSDTLVFLNPGVASRPEHAHLFVENGCFKSRDNTNGTILHRECNTGRGADIETALPSSFAPPKIDATRHNQWVEIVKAHAKTSNNNKNENNNNSKNVDASKSATKATSSSSTKTKDAPSTSSKLHEPKNVNISYHAVKHIPHLLARGNHSLPQIPVVVWPLWEFGIDTAEALHLETNGIQESPLLQLSNDMYNFDPNVIWMGDTGYAVHWRLWCDKFNEHVKAAQAKRMELGLPKSWPIYILDWTDGPTKQYCPQVEATVGKEFVSYSQRSVVSRRHWKEEKGWVNEGNLSIPVTKEGIPYRHTPLVVRTDIIANLQKALHERGLTLRDDIESMDRPIDVTHLWPLNPLDPNAKVGDVQSKLRTKVSNIVFDMGNKTNNNNNNNTTVLKVYADRAGNAARLGRRGVASAYVDAILNTKILIVTQRDGWEDHYRLFEGLISGAMVMTDRMLSLPAGLQNGTSVIEFGSEEQLRTLIDYYINKNPNERLAIAREGRRIAMMRHRTWHRMEEIVFGRALTICSDHPTTGCPFIVHANETSR